MLAPLLAALVVTAAPATDAPSAPAKPLDIAAPGLNAADVDPKKAQFFVDYFAQELSTAGHGRIHVVTQSEIATLIGFERQKQLLGCSDSSTSCITELGGALGSDAVLSGTIAKLGSSFAFTLKLNRSSDGKQLAAAQQSGLTEEQVPPFLKDSAAQFAAILLGEPVPPASSTGSNAGASSAATGPAGNAAAWLGESVPPVDNLLRFALLNVEYDRRIYGPLWIGARLSAFSAAIRVSPTSALDFNGSGAVLVRVHPYHREQGFSAGALVGGGAQVYYQGRNAGESAGVVPFATVGGEVGYRWVRLTVEVQFAEPYGNFETSLVPGLSVAVPL